MSSNISNVVPSPQVSNRKENGRKPWVFVGNLTEEILEIELHSVFSEFGQIIQIFLNLGFASVQMATQEGAARAVKHLDGFELYEKKIAVKLVSEGTSLKINTSPTSIKVEDLSPMVTNELLYKAFSKFGQVERAVVIVDNKGRSTTRGIVEFSSELSAQNAVKQIEENLFLITTSPRPISAKIIEKEDSIYGLSEEQIIKTTEYHRETMKGPRFAAAGSFEQQIAQTWKIRYQLERQQREQVEENIQRSRNIFEEQLITCFAKQQAAMKIKREVLSPSEQKVEGQRKKELEARKRVRMETQVADASQRNTDKTQSKKIILPASTSHNNFIEERNNQVSLIKTEPGMGHKRHLSNEDEKEPHKKRRELNQEENGETSSRETSSVVLWDGHKVANNGEVVPYETDDKGCDVDIEEESCGVCAKRYKNGLEAMKKYFCGPDAEERAKLFLQEHRLLPKQHSCLKCNRPCCYEKKRKRFRCNKSDYKGIRCRYSAGECKGTIFTHFRITYAQFMAFLFNYLFKSFGQGSLEKELRWSGKTLTQWTVYLGQVCKHFVDKQAQIGGPDTVVKVDEIFVCKRRDGGIIREFWLLRGMEEGSSDKKFLYYFEGQPCSSDNFLSIIEKFIAPGGSIITESILSFDFTKLSHLGYKHASTDTYVVYLGPLTADGIWGDLRNHVNMRGQLIHYMPLYICRYIFIKSFESSESRLHQFLQSIASLYPLP